MNMFSRVALATTLSLSLLSIANEEQIITAETTPEVVVAITEEPEKPSILQPIGSFIVNCPEAAVCKMICALKAAGRGAVCATREIGNITWDLVKSPEHYFIAAAIACLVNPKLFANIKDTEFAEFAKTSFVKPNISITDLTHAGSLILGAGLSHETKGRFPKKVLYGLALYTISRGVLLASENSLANLLAKPQ